MQAEGGASLSDARIATAPRILFVLAAVVGLAIDQVSKALVVAKLTPGERHDLVGKALRLDLIRNPGAAFSTGTSHTEWFAALAVVASIVVVWFGLRAVDRIWSAALGILLAGIVGNLLDRIFRAPGGFRGHVVDFLEFPHWPVFNLADVCINIAAVLIVIQAARGVRLDGARSVGRSAGRPDGS
jgi:signal peptidase II